MHIVASNHCPLQYAFYQMLTRILKNIEKAGTLSLITLFLLILF